MIYDVILILILGFFAWRGKKKGLFRSVLGFFSVIISYIVSGLISKPLGDMFRETGAYDVIYKKVEEFIPKSGGAQGVGILDSVFNYDSVGRYTLRIRVIAFFGRIVFLGVIESYDCFLAAVCYDNVTVFISSGG